MDISQVPPQTFDPGWNGRVVPEPILPGLGCELSVLVLLDVGASTQSEVLRVLAQALEFPCPSCTVELRASCDSRSSAHDQVSQADL